MKYLASGKILAFFIAVKKLPLKQIKQIFLEGESLTLITPITIRKV